MAVKAIIYEQQKNGGRVPHGLIPEVVDNLHERGIHVNGDILNGPIQRCQSKGVKKGKVPAIVATSELTTISDLTNAEDDNGNASTHYSTSSTYCGRLQSSTNKAKKDIADTKKRLMNEVAVEYSMKLHDNKNSTSQLPNRYLQKLVDIKKEELGIPDDIEISLKTIKIRQFRKSFTSQYPVTPSTLQEVDKLY